MMLRKWEREKGILAMVLPKYVPKKTQLAFLKLEIDLIEIFFLKKIWIVVRVMVQPQTIL